MRILRELSRRKLRTSLTVIGITIGIWALVVFSSMANQINGLVGMGSEFYADKIGAACDRIIRMRDGLVVADERVADVRAVAA